MARKHINIRAGFDLQGFSTSAQNLEREFKKTARKMQSIGKTLSMSLTAPIVGLAGLSVVNFDKQAKSIAQVEAGLKSTGGTVGKTSQELQKMAAELQNISLFGDEDILKNITAQLLTFTNITGDEFGRAQQAVADYASRTGRDLTGTSIMIGKALNDPIKGLAALGKAGVQFTDDQKVLIQSLVATGRAADAQKLILEELEKQYGGSAKAAADAGMGPLQQIKNSIMDVTEAFGEIIVEYIKPLADKVKALATRFGELSDSKKRLIVIIGAAAAAIGPVMMALGFLGSTVIPALIGGFGMLSGAILPAIAAMVVLKGVYDSFIRVRQQVDSELQKENKNLETSKSKFNALMGVLKDTNSTELQRKAVMKQINDEYKDYLPNLITEKTSLQELESIQKRVNNLYAEKIIFNAYEDEITKTIKKQVEAQRQLLASQNDLNQKRKSTATGDIVDFKGIEALQGFNQGAKTELEQAEKNLKNIDLRYKELAGSMGLDFDKLRSKLSQKVEPKVPTGGGGSKSSGEPEASAMKQLQSKLADIQFAGAQRLRQIRHEIAMLSMQDEEQIALERLNFAQEQAENELDFQIAQLENKKVLSEDEKAQLANLQSEKAAIIEQYFAELAAMENDANANQLGIKEAALKKQNDLLQLENANAAATQEEYNKAEKEREENHLKALIDLRKQYGKEVTDLEIQLAEKKFEVQKGANSKAESLAADLGALISNQISAIVNSTMGSLADFVRDAAAGVEKENKNFGDSFMANVGKFMQDLGKAMVAIGVANLTIIKGLAAGPLGAPLLIAGGVALLAAGAAMEGVYSKGIGSASESGGSTSINAGVTNIDAEPIVMETRIEGNQLILVQNRSNSFRR